MQNLHSVFVPWSTGREELQSLLIGKWKHCTKYGGIGDTKPCIRVRFNDKMANPLRKCHINDDRIKKFGCNMMKAYQAAFVFHHGTIPAAQYRVSHICGRFQAPKYYNDEYSLCIEPTHMLPETKSQDTERKSCHRYIRLFKNKVMVNKPKGSKQTITVADIQQVTNQYDRREIIKRVGIKQSIEYINKLINHTCNCNTKSCFINYGGAINVTANKQTRNIIYQ